MNVSDGAQGSFTVDEAGAYFLKETDWPAGVIDPSLVVQSGQGVYVDNTGVYYGHYTLTNDQTNNVGSIANTANTGRADHHQDRRQERAAEARGAPALRSAWIRRAGIAPLVTILTNAGFAVKSGTFYARTVTTGTDGAFRATSLPVYNGTNKISYTVTEVAAPANYLLDATSQTPDARGGGERLRCGHDLHESAHGQGRHYQDLLQAVGAG